ncbi:hypothetical protein [Aestuariivirga sp.]|uniref:hypothetical protein n=1 Tax=Aestuariivirga sp. TaxID=2650926 RepID=UPI0039E651AD
MLSNLDIDNFPTQGKTRPDEFCEKLIQGPAIGRGEAREVFEVKSHPALVVKRVHQLNSDPNYIEWII